METRTVVVAAMRCLTASAEAAAPPPSGGEFESGAEGDGRAVNFGAAELAAGVAASTRSEIAIARVRLGEW
jgi:hypothetical protein